MKAKSEPFQQHLTYEDDGEEFIGDLQDEQQGGSCFNIDVFKCLQKQQQSVSERICGYIQSWRTDSVLHDTVRTKA